MSWRLVEYRCMKQCQMCLGPGFESRQVHQKQLLRLGRIGTDLITPYRLRLLLMGLNMVSTGQGVAEWTAG